MYITDAGCLPFGVLRFLDTVDDGLWTVYFFALFFFLFGFLNSTSNCNNNANAAVREVLGMGMRLSLVPRLNNAAERQLPLLEAMLAAVTTNDATDRWELTR